MWNSRASRLALVGSFYIAIGCRGNVTDELIRELGNSDPQRRRAAAQALADHPEAAVQAVPALERTLADTDGAVRLSSALTIQKLDPDNENFPPVIIAALRAGHAPIFIEVGRMGAEALWAVPTLVKLLDHPQSQIRALATQTLGQIGVSDEVKSVRNQRLRDPEPAVQRAAQRALDQARSPATIESESAD